MIPSLQHRLNLKISVQSSEKQVSTLSQCTELKTGLSLLSMILQTMLQAEIYEYGFALLGAIGFAGIVMFISATVKNNVLALLFSLAVVYGPMMVAQYLPYKLQKALDLLPLVGSGTDIFRTNTFRLFGKYVWSPYLLITIPVMIGICCMPFAVRNWSRRLKA